MSFFAKKKSIVLVLDYQDRGAFSILKGQMDEQLTEVAKYFRFNKLSETVERLSNKKSQGFASVVIKSARKGCLLEIVPELLGREIPMTVFLDFDCIGLNRLPVQEELEIYHHAYPARFPKSEFETWQSRALVSGDEANEFLKACRRELGPLPIDKLDPLSFFSTWGKLAELPPTLVEFGLNIDFRPERVRLSEMLKLGSQQVKQEIKLVQLANPSLVNAAATTLFRDLGLHGCLTNEIAEITPDTDPFHLPAWDLSN